MLVFVDESGDAGLKIAQGSSPFFVVTAVLFDAPQVALACNNTIVELRKTLSFRLDREFHFNKCSHRVRDAFLRAVGGFSFVHYSIVVPKEAWHGKGRSIYHETVNAVFADILPLLVRANVYFDTCGNRAFVHELRTQLRTQLATGPRDAIRRFKAEKSHNNNLIQLADMVCGATARSFNTAKVDHGVFRSLLKRTELGVRVWDGQ